MTPEQAAALRAPFPPEAIGKLPKVNCGACVAANKQQKGATCDKHTKRKCDICDAWISTAHIHLDYVGHAGTTDRLLQCDPDWTWEPVAVDQNGAPVITNGGLWIRMTVCGVSRLGWGDGPDIKQMISDAIRNAAMRFGVALDLWSKEDLHSSAVEAGEHPAAASPESTSPIGTPGSSSGAGSSTPPGEPAPANLVANLRARAISIGDTKRVDAARAKWNLPKLGECNADQLRLYGEMLRDIETELEAPFEVQLDRDNAKQREDEAHLDEAMTR